MAMTKERPILYSTPMVLAKQARLKTQTRRIIKESFNGCLTGGPHPCPNEPVVIHPGEIFESPANGEEIVVDWPEVRAIFHCSTLDSIAKCPWGKVGDIIWGRETHCLESDGGDPWIVYKADYTNYPMGSNHWKPSIFMRKVHARIWDRITSIRVERLQDISEHDAQCEGHDILLHGDDSMPQRETVGIENDLNVIGCELKDSYFDVAVKNCRNAILQKAQLSLI